jgi:lipopolysaccharide assembly protein A
MRLPIWLFRAFIFFTLFAFALNNQQLATVHWFFGAQWQAPLVIVVLVAFAGGCAIGVLAMVPSWWRHRRAAKRQTSHAGPATPGPAVAADAVPEHPPRDGL